MQKDKISFKTLLPEDRDRFEHLRQRVMAPHRIQQDITFAEIAGDLSDPVLGYLGVCDRKRLHPASLSHRIRPSSWHEFMRTVLRRHADLPREELLSLWYECFTDRTSLMFSYVDTPHGQEKLTGGVRDPELLARLPITDPLLLDSRAVLHRYCQAAKPGWRMLRCLGPLRLKTLKLPDILRSAIADDSPEEFAMTCEMTGQRMSFSLLAEIVKGRGVRIFRSLIAGGEIEKTVPLDEICAYLTVRYPDERAPLFLQQVEDVHPGFIAACRDVLGRNLLWYVMQNQFTIWLHPQSSITRFLLKAGCDPDNENQFGLSWRHITENLPPKQKKALAMFRYWHGGWAAKISIQQLLAAL